MRIYFKWMLLAFLMTYCTQEHFDEYPPDLFLTKSEQSVILRKFLSTFLDTLNKDALNDSILFKSYESAFKLKYFVYKKSNGYYLITECHNPFFDSGYICYLGKIYLAPKDTIFERRFETETESKASYDSVRRLFEHMVKSD